jgi:hypothetical protein
MVRLAAVTLLGSLSACHAPSQGGDAPHVPVRQEAPAVVLTKQQVDERGESCARKSGEGFHREWPQGTSTNGHAQVTAGYAHHYNAKLDACFYLLTVIREAEAGATLSRKLIDVNENEVYGEYLGPVAADSPVSAFPAECRVAGMYCASEREWDVLVSAFMEG